MLSDRAFKRTQYRYSSSFMNVPTASTVQSTGVRWICVRCPANRDQQLYDNPPQLTCVWIALSSASAIKLYGASGRLFVGLYKLHMITAPLAWAITADAVCTGSAASVEAAKRRPASPTI